jgi:hypothetical protein
MPAEQFKPLAEGSIPIAPANNLLTDEQIVVLSHGVYNKTAVSRCF